MVSGATCALKLRVLEIAVLKEYESSVFILGPRCTTYEPKRDTVFLSTAAEMIELLRDGQAMKPWRRDGRKSFAVWSIGYGMRIVGSAGKSGSLGNM